MLLVFETEQVSVYISCSLHSNLFDLSLKTLNDLATQLNPQTGIYLYLGWQLSDCESLQVKMGRQKEEDEAENGWKWWRKMINQAEWDEK